MLINWTNLFFSVKCVRIQVKTCLLVYFKWYLIVIIIFADMSRWQLKHNNYIQQTWAVEARKQNTNSTAIIMLSDRDFKYGRQLIRSTRKGNGWRDKINKGVRVFIKWIPYPLSTGRLNKAVQLLCSFI